MASVAPKNVPSFVDPPRFEDYRENTRTTSKWNGVSMLRMHTKNMAIAWSSQLHRAIHETVHEAAADSENHVLILTATGHFWSA